MKGLFYAHSEYSLRESALSIKEICDSAKNMGFEAVCLADHNTLAGIIPFIQYAKSIGLVPIPGIMLDVFYEDGDLRTVMMFAKDNTGLTALSKLIGKTVTKDLLMDLFASKSVYHNHVFLSAPIENGPLPILDHFYIEKKIREKEMEMLHIHDDEAVLSTKMAEKNACISEIEDMKLKKDEAGKKKDRNFSKKEERIRLEQDPSKKEEMTIALLKEKEESEASSKEWVNLRARIRGRKKKLQKIDSDLAVIERNILRRDQLQKEIDELSKSSGSPDMGNILSEVRFYQDLFGDMFSISVMFHGKPEEDYTLSFIRMLNVPFILSNHAFTIHGSDEELKERQIIRSIDGWKEIGEYDNKYCMDSDWSVLTPDEIRDSLSYMDSVISECDISLHDGVYSVPYQSEILLPPYRILEGKVRDAISEKFGSKWNEIYEQRLSEELSVIRDTGYANALLLIHDVLSENILSGNGENGLVCYLLGITNIDPISYDIPFGPELSSMTVSVSAKSYNDFINKMGDRTFFLMGEKRFSFKEAVRTAGRVLSYKRYGSPSKLIDQTEQFLNRTQSFLDDPEALCAKFPDDRELIETAMHLDNALVSMEKDPSCICFPSDYLPECAERSVEVTGEHAKDAGLFTIHIKKESVLDLLSDTAKRIKASKGVSIDSIPEDPDVFKIYRSGDTEAIYLSDIPGINSVWKDVKNISDLCNSVQSVNASLSDALLSYRTAWMRVHYPKEFMIERLNYADPDEIPQLIRMCREYGFEVACPDINHSAEGFSEYDQKILFGLSIRGLKNIDTIFKNRCPVFRNFADFILKCRPDRKSVETLIKAGAFTSFCKSRTGLLSVLNTIFEKLTKLEKIEKRIFDKEQKAASKTPKQREKLQTAIFKDKDAAEEIIQQIKNCPLPLNRTDSSSEVLEMEKEVLSVYISTHPVDIYEEAFKGLSLISSIKTKKDYKTGGLLKNLCMSKTRNGDDMCTFDLEDKTGSIRCVCLPGTYQKYKHILTDPNIVAVKVFGTADLNKKFTDTLELIASYIDLPVLKIPQTIAVCDGEEDFEKFKTACGSRLYIYKPDTGQIKDAGFCVSADILTYPGIRCTTLRKYIDI